MPNGDSYLDRESAVSFSRIYSSGELIAGKYRLESLLGEGGMGMVWLARNEALDSRVALKLIRADFQNEETAGRLLKEARAAAKLEHRGIVRVFDFGKTDNGDPFIVMELLDGRSFGDVLERHTRLSAVRAVQTMLPVIDALGFAHRQGIVHRDLKPDNIFLARQTKRTQPKVVDFGIAKMDQGDGKRGLTQHGTVVGSPGYMSPEQARGSSHVDHRADVWAVCVVLYEAVTGVCAFDGDNYNAMMRSIIEDHPAPITELAAGDDDLWRILARGLDKEPDARWQTMRDLGKALAEWLLCRGIDRDITGEALEHVWMTEQEDAERDVFSAQPPPSEAAVSIGRSLGEGPPTLATPKDGSEAIGRLSAPGIPRELLSSRPPSTNSAVSIGPEPTKMARITPWVLWSGAAALALVFVFLKAAPSEEARAPAPSAPSPSVSRPSAEEQASAPAAVDDLTFEVVDAGASDEQSAPGAGPSDDSVEAAVDGQGAPHAAPAGARTPKPARPASAVATSKPTEAAATPPPRRRAAPAPRAKPSKAESSPQAPVLKDPYE